MEAMLDFSISTTHSSSKLVFFVFVTYLFYSNFKTTQTSLFFLTLSIYIFEHLFSNCNWIFRCFCRFVEWQSRLVDERVPFNSYVLFLFRYGSISRCLGTCQCSIRMWFKRFNRCKKSVFFDFSSFEKNFYINIVVVHLF